MTMYLIHTTYNFQKFNDDLLLLWINSISSKLILTSNYWLHFNDERMIQFQLVLKLVLIEEL